ncbi:MAG TPA: hypothetical protein VFD92_07000, partial [Candidatus Binatia bacterium]|nr:hypothetical protein [Candidatus Binatia bacterium]
MTTPPAQPLEAAALYFVPTLLWAVLCERTWYFSRTRRPHSWFFRMLPLVSGLMAFHLALNALGCLVPREIYAIRPRWLVLGLVLNDLSIIATVALFRHLLRFVPGGGGRPTRLWLGANYGAALVVAWLCLFLPSFIPGDTFDRKLFVYVTILQVYTVGMFGLIAAQAIRV